MEMPQKTGIEQALVQGHQMLLANPLLHDIPDDFTVDELNGLKAAEDEEGLRLRVERVDMKYFGETRERSEFCTCRGILPH